MTENHNLPDTEGSDGWLPGWLHREVSTDREEEIATMMFNQMRNLAAIELAKKDEAMKVLNNAIDYLRTELAKHDEIVKDMDNANQELRDNLIQTKEIVVKQMYGGDNEAMEFAKWIGEWDFEFDGELWRSVNSQTNYTTQEALQEFRKSKTLQEK